MLTPAQRDLIKHLAHIAARQYRRELENTATDSGQEYEKIPERNDDTCHGNSNK
jgi:hypothetical protein